MDSWIFRAARKICLIAFVSNIFIHAVIGMSTHSSLMESALSMGAMLVLLVILSRQEFKRDVKKRKKKGIKASGRKAAADG